MIETNSVEKLICESCGKDFECGAKSGKCWCFDVDLDIENLADLTKKFDKCLCPSCLKNQQI